jgi:hypothetical protein
MELKVYSLVIVLMLAVADAQKIGFAFSGGNNSVIIYLQISCIHYIIDNRLKIHVIIFFYISGGANFGQEAALMEALYKVSIV